MKQGYRVLILLATSLSILRADMMIKVRTAASGGRASETTEYYKGSLLRRDFGKGYQVVDLSTSRGFSVGLAERQYSPFEGSKLAPKQVVDSSHQIFIDSTCSATGETRSWLGYTARRYLTVKKSHEERSGKSSAVSETHIESWALDFTAPSHIQAIADPAANAFLAVSANGRPMIVPDLHVTYHGPPVHGLLVSVKTDRYRSEVVGLSLAPLPASLFEVPVGFTKVTPTDGQSPAWGEQIESEWMRVRAWLNNVFSSKM